MPKQVYNNTDFSGGVNGIDSPRDVKDNEVIKAKSAEFDEKGRVRMMGGSILSSVPSKTIDSDAFEPGTSFFHFAHDYNMLNADGDMNVGSTAIGGNWTFDFTSGDVEDMWTTGSSHGLAVGDAIRFLTSQSQPDAYNANTTYYVVHVESATKLQLSNTIGGSVIEDGADSSGNWTATDEIPSFSETDFYAIGNREHVAIFDTHTSVWKTDAIDMGAEQLAGNRKTGFYFAKSALRCYSQSLDSGIYSRWHGHIKQSLFENSSGVAQLISNHWYTTTTKLLAPASSADTVYSETVGSESPGRWTAVDSNGSVVASTTDNLKISLDDQGTGTWIAGEYPIYLSYIYDGSQESKVVKVLDMDIAVNKALYLAVTIDYTISNGDSDNFNSRITGARIYYSDPDDGDGSRYHLMDIDFSKGCKKFDEGGFTAWNDNGSNVFECPNTVIGKDADDTNDQDSFFKFEDMPKSVTYDMLNGYGPDETTDAEFKCHTLFNNRIYIGNIKQDGKTYTDRIIRSPINFNGEPQHDTFPSTHKMDVAANDGDAIVALEGFGDRLLVFKKKAVYVLNISQDGAEFVESKFTDIGIINTCQVSSTEFGICWVNDRGCYLYSDGRPINLIEGKLSPFTTRYITPRMRWNIIEARVPTVTYLPNSKKLVVSLGFNAAESATNDGWVYNFNRKSWAFGAGILGSYLRDRSNFITDGAGTTMFAQLSSSNLDIFEYGDSETAHTEYNLWFKDLDFGQPNVRKKIYKAYLQFRSNGTSNVDATYCVNGNYSEDLNFANGTGISSNMLAETAAAPTLLINGFFEDDTTSAQFQAVTNDGDGSVLPGTTTTLAANWKCFTTNQNTAGTFVASPPNNDICGVKQTNSDTDGVIWQSFSVDATTQYRVRFILSGMIPAAQLFPPVMCWISNTYDNHANLISGSNDLAHIVGSTNGTYSFDFTSASDTTLAIGFRAVKINGTADPLLYASYVAAGVVAPFPYNFFNFGRVVITKVSEWSRAELKPNVSSEANNVYSFGLKLNIRSATTVPPTFEVDNLSVVYRTKNVK